MNCPKCGGDCYVIESRTTDTNTVRRRRECSLCGERFTTREFITGSKEKVFKGKVLSRESRRIINALQHCAVYWGDANCVGCPMKEEKCENLLPQAAALIEKLANISWGSVFVE